MICGVLFVYKLIVIWQSVRRCLCEVPLTLNFPLPLWHNWWSARALEQDDKICSSVALLPHGLYNGSSLIFHVHRLVGLGNISYTELIVIRILLVFILQGSFHGIFLARTDYHLSQLPCFFWATALVVTWASSSPCRTSSWTNNVYLASAGDLADERYTLTTGVQTR